MYRSVRQFFKEHEATFAGIGAIAETLPELEDLLRQIHANTLLQSASTTGLTVNKEVQRQQMTELALELGNALAAYAVKIKNPELKNRIDFTRTDLNRAKDTEIDSLCELIAGEADRYLEALNAYGVNAEKTAALRTALDAYGVAIGKRRLSQGTKVAATQELDRLFMEVDFRLREVLDRLMLPFQKSNPALYGQYQHARQVLDLGKGRRTLVTDTSVLPPA